MAHTHAPPHTSTGQSILLVGQWGGGMADDGISFDVLVSFYLGLFLVRIMQYAQIPTIKITPAATAIEIVTIVVGSIALSFFDVCSCGCLILPPYNIRILFLFSKSFFF